MRRLCAALAVVASVTNSLQCRAPRTVRARTAGLLRALDARQPGAASRRTAAGAAAVGALVTPDLAGAATTPAVEDVVENPALVWKQGEKRDAACNAASVRKAFPGPFVNYLSRFLLSYDEGAAPSGAPAPRRSPSPGTSRSATPQLGVRQLLSLLKSRYGLLPDAQRQLSLLFSLLDPPLQPSEAIASLAARYENATVAAVDVVDGGSYAVSDAAASRLSARCPPAAAARPRLGAPRFAPTGRILGFIVTEAGCGYGAPPDVTVSAPRRAVAASSAVVDDKGRLRGVELVDGGVGYVPSGPENDLTRSQSRLELAAQRAAADGRALGAARRREFVADGAVGRRPRARLGRGDAQVPSGGVRAHRGASRSMRSDMTPVRRPVELRGGQLVRLALAGAICTATTRAVLNPLELEERAQASRRAERGTTAHGAASPWLGVEATAAAGAALGTSSFGVYELLQRALPKLSNAFFADPGFATAHELELSLASSFGAVLVAAALVAPLEAAKAPGVARRGDLLRRAGAAGALLSTPADAVVTELATGKHGSDWTKALAAITGAEGEAEPGGPRGRARLFGRGPAVPALRGHHHGAARLFDCRDKPGAGGPEPGPRVRRPAVVLRV
ncbi:hypothetical protein JL720_11224 [Aureococcus anophagefferens]|nr:hypothetical protein JL720_11224 [Aureococcus anophagefferens]